jgi:hypothetical protein
VTANGEASQARHLLDQWDMDVAIVALKGHGIFRGIPEYNEFDHIVLAFRWFSMNVFYE